MLIELEEDIKNEVGSCMVLKGYVSFRLTGNLRGRQECRNWEAQSVNVQGNVFLYYMPVKWIILKVHNPSPITIGARYFGIQDFLETCF